MFDPSRQLELPLPEQSEIPADEQDVTPESCGVPSPAVAPLAPHACRAPRSGARPSLDTKCQNPTEQHEHACGDAAGSEEEKNKKENENPPERTKLAWDRKQKRAYQKAITLFKYWHAAAYQVFFVTLTGAPESSDKLLSYHHERLKLQVSRRFLLGRIEHFKVITREGHGVIHALWTFPPHGRGVKGKAVFVPQQWLSAEWQRIHGAKIVDIRRVKMGHGSRRRLSRYIVSQYCGGQSGFVRSDYTSPKWLGFSIRATWARLKREWHYVKYRGVDFGALCKAWESLVSTRSCQLGGYQFVIWQGDLVEV